MRTISPRSPRRLVSPSASCRSIAVRSCSVLAVWLALISVVSAQSSPGLRPIRINVLAAALAAQQAGSGVQPGARPFTPILTSSGLGTTSTDGFSLVNNTAATGGATVQISPRVRWRGTAWDTAASETVDFFAEVLPATAATPTGQWKLGYSLNGAGATYPFIVGSNGNVTVQSSLLTGGANTGLWFNSGSNGRILGPADAQFNFVNSANAVGVGIDTSTDAVLKVRTRAQSGDAAVTSSTLSLSTPQATAGADATMVDVGSVTRQHYAVTITPATGGAGNCGTAFLAAALTADCTIATLPAGMKLVGVYADVTAGFTCSGTCSGTKVLQAGTAAGGTQVLAASLNVATTGTFGLADADLGSGMTRAAAIQGGLIGSWSATTPISVRFTSGTGNWGSGAATFVNAGSVKFTLITEQIK